MHSCTAKGLFNVSCPSTGTHSYTNTMSFYLQWPGPFDCDSVHKYTQTNVAGRTKAYISHGYGGFAVRL